MCRTIFGKALYTTKHHIAEQEAPKMKNKKYKSLSVSASLHSELTELAAQESRSVPGTIQNLLAFYKKNAWKVKA